MSSPAFDPFQDFAEALTEEYFDEIPADPDVCGCAGPHCISCGCCEHKACDGGCVWATPTLCSRCVS